MFGSKLKTWMENHIGRPKRKEKAKEVQNGGRGPILESSESLAQSDTGISSGSQQILSSSTTDNRESYCTTTMESEKSGMSHCHTNISLPSPESAYSTGYSTDGASPGGSGPPEYYINIRTGKHYFPSPAPTPTSPQPNTTFSHLYLNTTAPFLTSDTSLPPVLMPNGTIHSSLTAKHNTTYVPETSVNSTTARKLTGSPATISSHFDVFNFSKSPNKKSPTKSQLSSFKLFLKSPKQDVGKTQSEVNKTPLFENKKKVASPGKNKKWYKQPFQKFGYRRADSSEESPHKTEMKREMYLDRNLSFLVSKEKTASPRQRNRIKTNPWLPTEPMSSQNFHILQISFPPKVARNRSCSNTPLQNRKVNEIESMQNRLKQMSMKYEESKNYLNNLEKVVNRHVAQKLCTELSDHSEEDLTLNEMMGTYNESYVYEKETDILSDSDPTDCEDYVSDSDADNGGDERDSHDDELDFIDNESITESDDNLTGNTGKCTYHDIYAKKNSFLLKSDRHHSRKGSESRRSFKRELDPKGRKLKEEKKRRSMRKSFKCENSAGVEEKRSEVTLNENVGGLNLSRVLMQKMMAKNGSKSADCTPVTLRRRKPVKKFQEASTGGEKPKLRDSRALSQDKNILLVDTEADKKYNELIMEAENIFESLQNSPVIQSRKKLNILEGQSKKPKTETIEIWKKTEAMCCPQFSLKEQDSVARKSPKTLGLSLASDETPKKLRPLDFDSNKKTSFKAKSSAHSPLDPLGPTFRNFSVFKPKTEMEKICTSSSEDSEPNKSFKIKAWDFPEGEKKIYGSPIVPIAFQSVDLGKPLTSYCPQSEPVKRKIYSCSKTYDRLVKQFEGKPTIFEENMNERSLQGSLAHRKYSEKEKSKQKLEGGNQGILLTNCEKRRENPFRRNESLEKCSFSAVAKEAKQGSLRSATSSPAASFFKPSHRLSFDMDVLR